MRKNAVCKLNSDVETQWNATIMISMDFLRMTSSMYRVFLKKVLHKREEKMQEKMKMTSQKDKNLVQVQ